MSNNYSAGVLVADSDSGTGHCPWVSQVYL